MSHESVPAEPALTLQLPTLIISPTDVARLRRELVSLEDYLQQNHIRHPDLPIRLPRTSSLFEELGTANKLDWLIKEDRQKAATFLEFMKTQAPVIHISFAADPSAIFMAKLVIWLRHNLHPQLLIRIGLQPTMAAGCIIRTKNRIYDFSLRQHLIKSRDVLVDILRKNAVEP